MAAKLITVSIDNKTAETSIDLAGFHGKGCADVIRAFDGLGRKTKDIKKPEYKQTTVNLQNK